MSSPGQLLNRYFILIVMLGGLLLGPLAPFAAGQSSASLVVWSNDYSSSHIQDPSFLNGTFVIDVLWTPGNATATEVNGFDIKMNYNPNVLTPVDVDWRAPLCPLSEGCLFDYNNTISPLKEFGGGNVRLAVTILADTVTGSGTFFRIIFQVNGPGKSLLDIQESVSFVVGPLGGQVQPIPYESTDGTFSNITGEPQPPIANFTYYPPDPAAGQNVLFDGSSSYDPDFPSENGIEAYFWDFGDGTTGPEGVIVSHSFLSSGFYPVTLTVLDFDSLNNSITQTIFVQQEPAHDLAILSLSLLGPSPVPAGQVVTAQVVVGNNGNSSEVSTLRLAVDGIPLVATTLSLTPGIAIFVSLDFSTSGLSTGQHTVLVSIDPVPGETITGNNSMIAILTVAAPPPGPSTYTRVDLPHQFITGGTPLGIHGLDQTVFIPLPFPFKFYQNTFNGVWASTNGLVTFFGPDASYFNSQDLLKGKFAIAPLWDDMDTFAAENDIFTLAIDSSHFMIRWQEAYHPNPSVIVNFEAILGSDGTIQFNYGSSNGQVSATIGISNGSGDAITEDLSFINNRGSILFLPFKPEHDLAVSLNVPQYIPSGGSALIAATAVNQGVSDETDVVLELQVDGVQVNATTIPLLASNSSSVSVSYYWTPATLGNHTIRATISIVPGENATANNEATAVVDVREPLIRPQTGQYAEYMATIVNLGSVQTVHYRIEYGEYISPEWIEVTITITDPSGFNFTGTQRVNVFTRETQDGFGGFWFGWIETDIGIGSTVNLGFLATVEAREPFITPLGVIDAWRLEPPPSPDYLDIWYDTGVGVLLGYNQTSGSYSVNFMIVETNIPLTTLRVHEISLAPIQGTVGTTITVSGSDAEAGHEFEIRWDGKVMGTVVAGQQETFTFSFNAPPSPAGPHTVTVIDLANGFPAHATFTIVPSISISPTAGPAGTLVSVHGSGMPAHAFLTVNFGNQTFATTVADVTGSFATSFLTPQAEPGDYLILVQSPFTIILSEPSNTTTEVLASAVFTVIDETALTVVADTGAVYFPADSADVFIQVSFHGSPVDPTGLTVRLRKPDGTTSDLTTTRLGTGLYKATISVPSATGTYLVEVGATYQTHSVNAHGSTIDVFEVKPSWLSDRSRTTITVAGSILATMAAAGLVLYRTRKKTDSTALPF